MTDFERRNRAAINGLRADEKLQAAARAFLVDSAKYEYSYHFTWLGLPIIQFPQDIVAVQEILWAVQPDLVVETGIARGGSLVLSASMLELAGGSGLVVGIDIDIRAPSRQAIESHRLASRIRMIEGSSVDPTVVAQVRGLARGRDRIVVLLDSNHSHDHVMAELEAYSSLVRKGGYVVAFDTGIELMPEGTFPDRPWGKGNSPATAVDAFLQTTDRFVVDHELEDKLLITVAPGGYLKCVKDPA